MIGYEATRMRELQRKTAEAAQDLRDLAIDDPAASDAMSAVMRIRFGLETTWLPALARVTGDTSMTGWEMSGWEAGGPSGLGPGGGSITFGGDDDEVTLPLVEVMLFGPDVWSQLSPELQDRMIREYPEVVIFSVLGRGGTVTAAQLTVLDEAISHPVFSEDFSMRAGASIGVAMFQIQLEGGVILTVSHMSDGSVQVVFGTDGQIGGGIGTSRGGATAVVGLYGGASRVLVFPDEETAAEHIEVLDEAARSGNLTAETVTRGIENGILFAAGGGTFFAAAWDYFGLPRLSDIFGDDEFDREFAEMFATYGVSTTREFGLFGDASGEVNEAIEAGVEGELSAGFYRTTPAPGVIGDGRQGVLLAGSLSASASAGDDALEASGNARGSVMIDIYREGDAEYVTFSIAGSASGGITGEVLDAVDVGFDTDVEYGAAITATLTVPIDGDTGEAVGDAVTALAQGEIPVPELLSLYDQAEITVTVDSATVDRDRQSQSAGPATVWLTTTDTTSANQVTLHKRPGGQLYSQTDAAEIIAEADGELEAA